MTRNPDADMRRGGKCLLCRGAFNKGNPPAKSNDHVHERCMQGCPHNAGTFKTIGGKTVCARCGEEA